MNFLQRSLAKLLPDSLKANPVFGMTFRMMIGRPVWTERNFKQFADEGYRKNPIVFKCVDLTARSIAAIPLYLMDKNGNEIDKHPALDLLKMPNKEAAGAKFFESVVAYRLLAGNSYLVAIGEGDEMKPRNPYELWILRPDRMRIVPGQYGVIGYQYEAGGAKKEYTADPIKGISPVLHWKTFNPTDDLYGMAPIEAAAYSVDQHNDASAWNKSLLQNSGQPSGAMVIPGTLGDTQYERMKSEMDQKLSGPKNSGKPLLLEGGLKWESFSLSPKEMDWMAGKHLSAREIALVYGVPTQLVGVPGESTYANYQEARMAFYEESCLPILDSLLDELNRWLLPMFDGLEGAKLCYDVDAIPALAPKRALLWTAVSAANFLSINEKRKQLGYDEIEGQEANEIFIPSGLLPLKGSLGEDDPEDTEMPEGGSDGEDSEDYTEPGKAPAKDPITQQAAQESIAKDTSLNGAQVTSLVDIIAQVAREEIPKEAAYEVIALAFPAMDKDSIRRAIESADKFKPAAKTPEKPT